MFLYLTVHSLIRRVVRLALDMYCKNPRVLDTIREFIVLPSNRLIRYYKNAVEQQPGWNDQIIAWCQKEALRQNLAPSSYWGGLIFDEMKIQVSYHFVMGK